MGGCVRATVEVIPAKNSRPNHSVPMNCPRGSCWKISGMDWNPRSYAPPVAIASVAVTPKKATATGIAMELPSTTSAKPLLMEVVRPVRATS